MRAAADRAARGGIRNELVGHRSGVGGAVFRAQGRRLRVEAADVGAGAVWRLLVPRTVSRIASDLLTGTKRRHCMSYVRCVRGIASGIEYSAEVPMNLDPADGRPVEMVLDLERLAAERPHAQWYDPARRDLWRFGALMALDIAHAQDARHIVALGEGCTPLLDYAHHPVASQARIALQVKEEGRAHPGYGANPTQSFKD